MDSFIRNRLAPAFSALLLLLPLLLKRENGKILAQLDHRIFNIEELTV